MLPPAGNLEMTSCTALRVCYRLRVALAWLMIAGAETLLTACADNDPEQLVASAQAYLARGDTRAATIQLRNALQQRPEDGSMRLLLGQVLLQGGDPASAERELRKALQYNQPADEVLPPLARALVERGQSRQLLLEFGARSLTAPQADSSLKASLGYAHLQTGQVAEAGAQFAAAVNADPDSVRARVGLARVLAVQGRIDDAAGIADSLSLAHPESAETLLLIAELRSLRGDDAGSLAAMEQAVRVDAAHAPARFALIAALIDRQDFDASAAQLDAARTRASGDLRIQYFDAVVALGRNDLSRARGATQQILKHAPEHVPTLVLAGTIELRSKQPAAAEAFLRKATALAPQQLGARRMLVRTYLNFNQPARALEALQPLLTTGAPGDALLAGETYFANGDLRRASTYFLQARDTADPQSAAPKAIAQTRLGQIALARGDFESGLRDLEAVVELADAPMQADLVLIAGYIQSDALDQALRAAQRLVKKHPGQPLAHQLLASTYLAIKDSSNARVQFQKALDLAPGYLPAVTALAAFDIAASKPLEARQRFESVIAKDPNEQALLGLANVMQRTGASAPEVSDTLRRAIRANSQSSQPRLALIAHHLRRHESGLALAAAQDAIAALPNDFRILYALGRAQDAAGQASQAIDTFKRLAVLEPQSTLPLTQLAAVYARQADFSKVVEVLQRARRIGANDPAMVRDLIAGYLLSGSPEDAVREARALQVSAPEFVAGYLLEGEVQSSVRRWPEAERAYRAGLKVEPDATLLAVKLHTALVAGQKDAEAEAFARRWLKEHPQDTLLRTRLAERALRAKNLRAAATLYREVVKRQPENFVALNNLAWTSGQIGDPRAIEYARRAAEIAPKNADVLDTLGSLLMTSGDSDQGIEYLGKATSLAPKRSEIRLNYAKALVKVGKTDLAKVELQALRADGDIASQNEATAVLRNL